MKRAIYVSVLLVLAGCGLAVPAILAGEEAGPAKAPWWRQVWGLSDEEVFAFDFGSEQIGTHLEWRIRRTRRDLLVMLRQKANFILQNEPDPLSRVNAEIVIGITNQMGIGDGPPLPPDDPGEPDPPPPDDPGDPPPPPPPGGALVVPGQPDRSPLVLRVEGKIIPQMPLQRPLPRRQAREFRRWVSEGATESGYRTRLEPIVKTSCVFCHSGETAAGGLSLASWDDLKARIARNLASR